MTLNWSLAICGPTRLFPCLEHGGTVKRALRPVVSFLCGFGVFLWVLWSFHIFYLFIPLSVTQVEIVAPQTFFFFPPGTKESANSQEL